ncbi:MAG: DEAD/DEAH box helicase [Gammaproteobacteria bacterium]|nr:DEAD/DEAH box helicase [Gammaproteobacteria bacterium]
MTDQVLTKQSFAEFDLPESLNQGLADAGFTLCTPIQAEALPPALAGNDVAGQAQTGTGKTAAFLLAIFSRLLREPPPEGRKPTQPRAIVLAPTRELAIQIYRDAQILGSHTGIRLVLVYGGTGYTSQQEELAGGVDVLIGTPGRLIDFFKQRLFDLNCIQVAVLDEADRMFDLGFIKDIRYVFRRMPPPTERLSMLFSATLSQRVLELAYEHMNDPQRVQVQMDKVVLDRITEEIYYPANEEKLPLLVSLLRHRDSTRSMVFVNTKRVAERLGDWLTHNGIGAAVISGDVPQTKRESLLAKFRAGNLPVLIATDVASRGLHIPDVSHVFNYDLPQDAEDYVHRIGRTARAGASGDAVSFACEEYAFSLMDIQEYIGHAIPVGKYDPDELPVLEVPPRRPRKPREAGRRGSGDGRRSGGGGRPGGGRAAGSGERSRRPRRDPQRDAGGAGRSRPAAAAEDRPRQPEAAVEKPAMIRETSAPKEQPDSPDSASPRRRRTPETPAIG